jgi:thymidylate kinase
LTIALEGASAAGKSTLARGLAARMGARVIPEVVALFERPVDEPDTWYLERQLDRWRMGIEAARTDTTAILDGDPFQPLWYGWTYGFMAPGQARTIGFYRAAIAEGRIAFPDRYILLRVSERALHDRKAGDPTRRRRNFVKHLGLTRSQPRYFDVVAQEFPGLVHWLDADRSASAVVDAAAALIECDPIKIDSTRLLDRIAAWISTTSPDDAAE